MPEEYLDIHASGRSAEVINSAVKLQDSLIKAANQNRQIMMDMTINSVALYARLFAPWWFIKAG